MRLNNSIRIIFILAVSCSAVSSKSIDYSGKLIWSDEFNYTGTPDSTKWTYETGDGCPNLCGWGNNELQVYTKELTNVRVENGVLVIDAVKSGSQWTSGRLTSRDKKSFTYGRFVFRAKLPRGHGSWPALWMLGENVKAKGWPACGEIDIMEHVGKNPGVIQSALHTPASSGNTEHVRAINVSTFDSDFHLYEANWSKKNITFSVDGKIYYTFEPSTKDQNTWPFDHPFYIIMNIAMGGNLGGPSIDPALSLARMEIDFVRVYHK